MFKTVKRIIKLYKNPLRSARMWILKKLINFSIRVISPLFPQRVPTRPAACLWTQVERHLKRAAEFQRELKPRDKNFLRLLNTLFRAVRYLAETDPYYQLWLGYFMKHNMTVYGQGFKDYSRLLNRQAETYPEFPQLRDPQFQLRAYHLKLCGGLQLIDEELAKNHE